MTRIESDLDEDHISSVLPLMANLSFLKKQDYKWVNTTELINMVNSFKRVTSGPEFSSLNMG